MAKRVFDIAAATLGLLVASPLLIAAGLGIRLSSSGPVLFRARRVGLNGVVFTMHKFRTMAVDSDHEGSSVITARSDKRVFWFGNLLRKTKIDELPQLWDVLLGRMSIVGPRPEDPRIVDRFYCNEYKGTLCVKPGLASPGSIFYYTHGEKMLTGPDPEAAYVERVLPLKMILELEYVRNSGMLRDLSIIVATVRTILQKSVGRTSFSMPSELASISRLEATRIQD